MPVLTLPAAPEFLSNYLLFNAHLISAAPRDDLHWSGVPVIVYFAIATTCPCLSRMSPKKCKICCTVGVGLIYISMLLWHLMQKIMSVKVFDCLPPEFL